MYIYYIRMCFCSKMPIPLKVLLILQVVCVTAYITQQTFVGLEDVFKTSWRHVLKTSSTPLQHNNFTSCKTSWKTKNCYAEDVLKTSWRHVLKMSWRHILKTSWRHYGEKQNTYWGSNNSKYASKKSIFHKSISDTSKANPKCINYNPIISPFLLFWNSRSISILRIKISDDWFGVVKSAEFKLEIAEKVRQ